MEALLTQMASHVGPITEQELLSRYQAAAITLEDQITGLRGDLELGKYQTIIIDGQERSITRSKHSLPSIDALLVCNNLERATSQLVAIQARILAIRERLLIPNDDGI